MNVKISDIKVFNKIFAKQRKQNKLTTLYKPEPFTMIEKKGNTVKIRHAFGKKRVRIEADVRCFWGRFDSLHKVTKRGGRDKVDNDFINETSFSDTKQSRQDQDHVLRSSTRQRRIPSYFSDYVLS